MHYSDVLKLNLVEGIGRKTILKLKRFCDKEELKDLEFKELITIIDELSGRKSIECDYDRIQIETEKILEKCYNENIKIATCFDDDFPEKFNKINEDSPALVFIKGDSSILHRNNNIAVIGTRKPTKIGFDLGVEYSEAMSLKGINIVSGLALGCDTAAHMGALKAYGKTLVTLPSGIGYVYPKANLRLYNEILDRGGCVISENIPGLAPRKYDFVNRDRLQAALSEAIMIIEAPLKSGTVYTYNYAKKYNKRVACSIHAVKQERNMELNKEIIRSKAGSSISNIMDLENWLQKIDLGVLL